MTKTTETFSRYDSADYLTTLDDAAAYLEATIEQSGDDPALITQALGAIARSGNVSELARRAGMSREGLYKALSPNGNPSFATILKITHALGLQLHVVQHVA
jgi:probable addiction module antidote protein